MPSGMPIQQRLRSPDSTSTSVALRLISAIGALAAGAAALVLVVDLLRSTPAPASYATPAANSTDSASTTGTTPLRVPAGFPAPPRGAVVFSRSDRSDVLALGLASDGGRVLAQLSVLGSQGQGVRNLSVRMSAGASERRAEPCGSGCYRATLLLGQRRPSVTIDVRGGGATTRWSVDLPAKWPASSAAKLMARATEVWRSLRSLTYVDRLSSGPGRQVTSRWQIVAPDRVAYEVVHGSQNIIIGNRRWDRQAGGSWSEGRQDPSLSQPVPFWQAVTDAHVVGDERFHGRPAWRVSFFDPVTLAWFEVELDRATLHVLDLRMNATAHFMHDTYRSFDGPIQITPPVSS